VIGGPKGDIGSQMSNVAEVSVDELGSTSSEPVRVLHLNSGNLYGGVETILVTLAQLRHLCPTMEPHFALCYEGRLSQELVEAGVPVHLMGRVRISRPWTVWRARRRLREILRLERFDLVICHMPWALTVFGKAVRAAEQHLVFWAHGFHHGRNWLEILARCTTPDFAIVNSRFTETGVAKLFPRVPRKVLYTPVALTDLPDADRRRNQVRHEQGIDDDTVVIVQVSRMEALKGHLLHLRALALLKDLGGWVCWIVGGPQKPGERDYFGILQKTATELGIAERVHFLGQRTDISQLLGAADIFCQPNERPEAFGIVFIEALWAGLPIVTTAMGGAVEIVDESCGLLVEPGNRTLLAESLRSLIESSELRSHLSRAGATRARQLSDPHTQMNRLRDLSQGMSGRQTRASQWSLQL